MAKVSISYLVVLMVLILSACSPAATTIPEQRSIPATSTETSFTPSAPFPTSTKEINPALPPAPASVSTSILRPGKLVTFASIDMNDEQNGWGIDEGQHILHTRDGGHTWKDVTPYFGDFDNHFKSLFSSAGFFALDGAMAWATTPYLKPCPAEDCTTNSNTAILWHTTDGGDTWQGSYLCLQGQECGFPLIIPADHFPASIQFLDEQTGWLFFILGEGMDLRYRLYRTTDGGSHWLPLMERSIQNTPVDNHENYITGLAFLDERTGWMSIATGTVLPYELIVDWSLYRSTDAGTSWEKMPLPTPDPLPESFVIDRAQCAALNMKVLPPDSVDVTFRCSIPSANDSGGVFYFQYHSQDGGKHWVFWQKDADLQFIDALHGWRITPNDGAYDLERTQDGGMTWTKVKTVQWRGSLDFISERVGWVLARSVEGVGLVHTTNGGKGWDEIKPLMAE